MKNEMGGLPIRLEPMTLHDIPRVMEIEQVSFPAPWSARAYEHELWHNEMAHYFVARVDLASLNRESQSRGLKAWLDSLTRRQVQGERIVGYVGYWLMAGEAHISTIAVDPQYRGRAFGEFMLAAVINDARSRGAHVVTLEVRVSNRAAQQLYHKYQFQEVGLRKQYYSDNNEDALIMTTPSLRSAAYQEKLDELTRELALRLTTTNRSRRRLASSESKPL